MRHRLSTRNTIPIQSLSKRTVVIAGIGLALLGIVLGVIGALLWLNVRNFVQTAEHAEGTVIELVENRGKEGNRTYRPLVEFTDHQGQRREFLSSSGSNPPRYSVGDKMPILYDRDRPNSASINHWLDLYLFPFVLGIVAAVNLIMSIVFFLLGSKKRKDGEEEPAAVPE